MLAAILLAELTLFVGLTQTGSGDSTRVVGRITQDSRPAAYAVVFAKSDSDVQWTLADAHGRYTFMTLLPGVYRFYACYRSKPVIRDPIPAVKGAPYAPLTLEPRSDSEGAFAELSAGVEYLANLGGSDCVWR